MRRLDVINLTNVRYIDNMLFYKSQSLKNSILILNMRFCSIIFGKRKSKQNLPITFRAKHFTELSYSYIVLALGDF